jgi:hypothetical protein
LAAPEPPKYSRPAGESKVDPFKDWICERLAADPRIQSQRLREMASELGYEGGKSIFELNEGDKHDHIVCVNTGKVVEFHDAEIEKRILKIVKDHGFELVDHVLHIRALAPVPESEKKRTPRKLS